MIRLCHKLKVLKEVVTVWIKNRKLADQLELSQLELADQLELSQLELKIHKALEDNFSNSLDEKSFEALKKLEQKKEELLVQEEKEWRLKSRAIWLAHGDKNSKNFHNFASARRNMNTIWEIQDAQGLLISGTDQLKLEVVNFFGNIYKDVGDCVLQDQIKVARLYPRFFNEHDVDHLQKEVSLIEIEDALKLFAKEKSPGPDGWSVELFIHFFDVMGD